MSEELKQKWTPELMEYEVTYRLKQDGTRRQGRGSKPRHALTTNGDCAITVQSFDDNAEANYRRLAECWNACIPFENPAEEIAALRVQVERLSKGLADIHRYHDQNASDGWRVAAKVQQMAFTAYVEAMGEFPPDEKEQALAGSVGKEVPNG